MSDLKPGDLFLQRRVHLEIVRITDDGMVVYRCRNFRKRIVGTERRCPLNIFLAQIESGVILPAGRLVQ